MKAPGVADAHRSHHSATAVLSWAVSQAPSTPPVAISSPPSCVSPLIQIASTTLSYADGRTGCIDLPALLSRPQRDLVSCKPGHLPPRRPRIAQFPTDSTSDSSNFSLTCSIHLRRWEELRSFPPPPPQHLIIQCEVPRGPPQRAVLRLQSLQPPSMVHPNPPVLHSALGEGLLRHPYPSRCLSRRAVFCY